MVVWFLAAMSLLVSGIVFQARVDTRMAQLHVARAQAVAAGDGAIQLMLADLVAGKVEQQEGSAAMSASYSLGERQVRVELVPASGLIDPTTAPPNPASPGMTRTWASTGRWQSPSPRNATASHSPWPSGWQSRRPSTSAMRIGARPPT